MLVLDTLCISVKCSAQRDIVRLCWLQQCVHTLSSSRPLHAVAFADPDAVLLGAQLWPKHVCSHTRTRTHACRLS